MVSVYVIGAVRGRGLLKLGMASKPAERLRTFQHGSAAKLRVLLTVRLPSRKLARKVEWWALLLLRNARRHGEWVKVALYQAVAAIKQAALRCGLLVRGVGRELSVVARVPPPIYPPFR